MKAIGQIEQLKTNRTCFEDLSNELFYEIFDYFHIFELYETFAYLNNRFYRLIKNSSSPISFVCSHLSKAKFHEQCKHILIPNAYRIISLDLSHYLLIDEYFSSYYLNNSFIRLESLVLNNVKSEKLIDIVENLLDLPSLSSLTIHSIDEVRCADVVYSLIICLPVLKYCKLSFGLNHRDLHLNILENMSSPIEQLIIDGECFLDKLVDILIFLPEIKYLSCHVSILNSENITLNFVPTNLINICFKLNFMSFDEFEWFISNFAHQLKSLTVSVQNDLQFLDESRWKKLISKKLIRLHQFNLQHQSILDNNFDHLNEYHILIAQFQTAFWYERRWFFTHQHIKTANDIPCVTFFSIQPYRWARFDLHETSCEYYGNDTNLADTVNIHNYSTLKQTSIKFKRTTRLLLSCKSYIDKLPLSFDLTNVFSPMKLTELIISDENLRFEQLILFISSFNNLQSLTIPTTILYFASPQNRSFNSVLIRNRIQSITIINKCSMQDVDIVIRLCTNLKSLEIKADKDNIELISRYLLMKYTNRSKQNSFVKNLKSNNHSFWKQEYINCSDCMKNEKCLSSKMFPACSHHLSYLCFRDVKYRMIEKFRNMIDQELLLENYSIEYFDQNMILWW